MKNILTIKIKWWMSFLIFLLFSGLLLMLEVFLMKSELELKQSLISARPIELYYYNPELDRDEADNIACSKNGLAPIVRQIPITQTPIQDAINLLLRGELTEDERLQGIETEYPLEGFSLKGALLRNGVLTLEFNDPQNMSVGGACRVGILWFQIEATAKQFPEVQQVRFLPEEIFQP